MRLFSADEEVLLASTLQSTAKQHPTTLLLTGLLQITDEKGRVVRLVSVQEYEDERCFWLLKPPAWIASRRNGIRSVYSRLCSLFAPDWLRELAPGLLYQPAQNFADRCAAAVV